jgi:hypothetical protein
MKKLLILSLFLSPLIAFCQPITMVGVNPVNPTTVDNVQVIVSMTFTSGDCQLYQQNYSVVGDSITVEVYHCVGPLAYICDVTDTIVVGFLPAGSYSVKTYLYTSDGMSGCLTFSIIDSLNYSFDVTTATAMDETGNPASPVEFAGDVNQFRVQGDGSGRLEIFDAGGRMIFVKSNYNGILELDDLLPGVYLFRLVGRDGVHSGKFVIH